MLAVKELLHCYVGVVFLVIYPMQKQNIHSLFAEKIKCTEKHCNGIGDDDQLLSVPAGTYFFLTATGLLL